jgi:hypothetical protein
MSRKLTQAVFDAALEAGEAAANSAVTVAARLPILMRPGAESMAEWQAASSEKIAAVWDGTWAVCAAWNAMFWRAALAPMTPTGVAHEALILVRAASKPGQVQVRANADRFRGL